MPHSRGLVPIQERRPLLLVALLLLAPFILGFTSQAEPPKSGPQISHPAPLGNSRNTLELPPVTEPRLSAPPPVLADPHLPSGFLGCWEGNPSGFDSVVSSPMVFTLGAPGRIVFCYNPTRVVVEDAQIRLSPGDYALGVALILGLGFQTAHVATGAITTDIYEVTPTQIRARSHIPLVLVVHYLYLLPVRQTYTAIEDELATLADPETILIQAHQELDVASMGSSVLTWHAYFHRLRPAP